MRVDNTKDKDKKKKKKRQQSILEKEIMSIMHKSMNEKRKATLHGNGT